MPQPEALPRRQYCQLRSTTFLRSRSRIPCLAQRETSGSRGLRSLKSSFSWKRRLLINRISFFFFFFLSAREFSVYYNIPCTYTSSYYVRTSGTSAAFSH